MKLIEILLLLMVVLLGAAYSIGMRNMGLAKIIAIPTGTVLSLATIAVGLFQFSSIAGRGEADD